MPFIIALRDDKQPMFYRQGPDGEFLLTPNRANATPFPEAKADQLAIAHNLYCLGEVAEVEGAGLRGTPTSLATEPAPDHQADAVAS